ncbi:hypothetical protein SAMN04487980_103933 [Streptomyces sp. cf124]|uniref:hypothetical protein n=1 Tax=Streptomyces sp. cf124 TaxID=1761903 RepID=UPI0008F2C334|nr:hypothetical protein [Streptomyces sp. cf124]SFN94212.1 hypothetical protein SAMN04487980_103933 [Streptomyces sp. cf124]
MTAEQQKKPRAEDDWTIEIVIVVAIVLLGVVGAWLAAKIGAPFADAPAPASNPLTFVVAMVKGDYSWPGSPASAVAAGEAVLLGILGTAAYRVVQRFKKKPKVDGARRPRSTPPPSAAAACRCPSSASSTRPPTSAAGAPCPTCTRTTARAASSS